MHAAFSTSALLECTPACEARMHNAEYPDRDANTLSASRLIDAFSFEWKLSATRTERDRVIGGISGKSRASVNAQRLHLRGRRA
jgi:hypothetical protein